MYVLHYAPDNASLILRLALEEIGTPYRAELVDRAKRAQNAPSYRAINPNGLIPALQTPQGVMFETGACLLWLADTHRMLAPTVEAPTRGAFLTWLFFCANTLHAQLRMLFYPHLYTEPGEAQAAFFARTQSQIATGLRTLNDHRALPHAVEVTDLYLAAMLRWCALYGPSPRDWFRLEDYPILRERAAFLETRPSVTAAVRAEGLGTYPFTAPKYPDPPEGSAL